jgi:transposase-like protein
VKAIQVIEEILSKAFKRHRFPVSLKAEAVLLYFKGLSLRTVREFLLHKGYEVSIEAIREWFHAVGKALQAIYTIAVWIYKELPMEWEHETFGKRNVVERWFFYIKHRIKRFYKRFPWNAKYETVHRWLASFIVIYTIMNLKS